MKRKLFITCCLIAAALHAEQWHTSIEYILPPQEKILPENSTNKNILIVNNAATMPSESKHVTIFLGENQPLPEMDLNNAPFICVMNLSKNLENYYFNGVYEVSHPESTSWHAISTTNANTLCYDYNSDILLILNEIDIRDTLALFQTLNGEYIAYINAFSRCAWELYDASTQTRENFFSYDTLFWETSDFDAQNALALLPKRQEALLEVAKTAGEKMAEQLCPCVYTADRYIFTEKQTQEGLHFFTRQQWQEAIASWQKNIEDASIKPLVKADAALNIALCYEMMKDLDNSLIFIQKAIDFLQISKGKNTLRKLNEAQQYLDEIKFLQIADNQINKL